MFALAPAFADEVIGVVGMSALTAGRQAGMDLLSANAGDIKRAVEAKSDVKAFKPNADAITAWGKAIPGLFLPGTDKGPNTSTAAPTPANAPAQIIAPKSDVLPTDVFSAFAAPVPCAEVPDSGLHAVRICISLMSAVLEPISMELELSSSSSIST